MKSQPYNVTAVLQNVADVCVHSLNWCSSPAYLDSVIYPGHNLLHVKLRNKLLKFQSSVDSIPHGTSHLKKINVQNGNKINDNNNDQQQIFKESSITDKCIYSIQNST